MFVDRFRAAAVFLFACLCCAAAMAAGPARNAAPTVTLTSPSGGATFTAPASITLSANAADSDGTVSKVEFFRGTTLIASVAAAPYTYSWTGVAAGTYSITAKATDNGGATATSAAAGITVGSSPGGGSGSITITSPTAATRFDWPITDVSGSFTGAADTTILVSNGASTVLGTLTSATTYTARNVLLDWGANTITATAVRRDGTSSTTSLALDVPKKLIAITSPRHGTTHEQPPSITFEVSIALSGGTVRAVEYDRDFTGLLGSVTTPPYTFVWNNPPRGSHGVYAYLVDEAGRRWRSEQISVYVTAPNVAPAVSLTAPADGGVHPAPASFQLFAAASDSDGGIAQVEFFQNGALLGVTNIAPYGLTVGNLGPGSYTFTARATDDRGGTATSAPVSVTVTQPNTGPTVNLTSPTAGSSYMAPATILLGATAADGDGTVSRVEFYAGSTVVATATAPPYTATWSVGTAGTYTFTAKAYDNLGLGAVSGAVTVSVGDGVTYLHNDFAGTPIMATGSNGAVLWKENLRPYGEKLNNPGAGAGNRLSFHGKPLDADTGLAYFGARYYDPVLGRFMGVDAVGFHEENLHSFNRYAYGNNSPYRYLDPDGNDPILHFQQSPVISIELGPRLIEPAPTNAFRPYVSDAGAGRASVATQSSAKSAAQAPRSAKEAADAALAGGKTRGAASELRVGDQVFVDVSGTGRALHPKVQAAYDRVPASERAPWHGFCAEGGCLSRSFDAGVNPAGGTSRAVNIGSSGKGHGTPKAPCSSCRNVLDQLGVKHE